MRVVNKMSEYQNKLEQFRDLRLSKEGLLSLLPKDHELINLVMPIKVCTCHVIQLLLKYQEQSVTEQTILDWVNTIWFSGWFEYCDEQADSIASVMNELEEIDEDGKNLTHEKVELFIKALKNNTNI